MTDTAQRILDTAQALIQTRGYSAMSFQDIAGRVGIRKPSVIHHYPSKAALGLAVIARYHEFFATAMAAVRADPKQGPWDELRFYTGPYRQFSDTPDTICLCGALAGEIMALPAEMRAAVEAFFDDHRRWLERLLREGRKSGDFRLTDTPQRTAQMILGALQGGLTLRRAIGDSGQLENVIHAIEAGLKPSAGR